MLLRAKALVALGQEYTTLASQIAEQEARWVGDDPDTDLAVLSIDGLSRGSLAHAPLGRSAGLKRGQFLKREPNHF